MLQYKNVNYVICYLMFSTWPPPNASLRKSPKNAFYSFLTISNILTWIGVSNQSYQNYPSDNMWHCDGNLHLIKFVSPRAFVNHSQIVLLHFFRSLTYNNCVQPPGSSSGWRQVKFWIRIPDLMRCFQVIIRRDAILPNKHMSHAWGCSTASNNSDDETYILLTVLWNKLMVATW